MCYVFDRQVKNLSNNNSLTDVNVIIFHFVINTFLTIILYYCATVKC